MAVLDRFYLYMRNQHMKFQDPSMYDSKDFGGVLQELT